MEGLHSYANVGDELCKKFFLKEGVFLFRTLLLMNHREIKCLQTCCQI